MDIRDPAQQPPFGHFMGMKITYLSKDKVEAEMPMREELNNRFGMMHGGAIMALADNLGGTATFANLKEGERTATVLGDSIRLALNEHTAIPEALVTNVQQRAQMDEVLQLDDLVDLVIPRGSYDLVRHVQSATRIPVLGHSEGVCHIYVDAAANIDMALAVIDDAKTDYPAACNAVETVLVG